VVGYTLEEHRGVPKMTLTTFRPFTVEDYHKMAEVGVFAPDERVELLGGMIRPMSPVGGKHVTIVGRLGETLVFAFARTYSVHTQSPFILSEESEPEPDAMVVKRYHLGDEPEKATAADVYLVVEVSDTTLNYDVNEKLPLYASGAIPEVWIIDVNRNRITQYHTPINDTYTRSRMYHSSDSIMTTLGIEIQAGDILL
jgi:Uma2 family endonuclease